MPLFDNPLYRLESRGRAPTSSHDLKGWLIGHGRLMKFWRLVPVIAVGSTIAISAASLPNAFAQAISEFAIWMAAMVLSAMIALVGCSISTGRDWQEGRMEEWKTMPIERSVLVAGKVWAWTLPLGASLTIGAIVSSVIWWAFHRAGVGIPLFAPLEGVLTLLDSWAVLFMCASVGVWSGNYMRRGWLALVVGLILGMVLLAAIVFCLVLTFDRALLGGHLIVIGSAWLLGNVLNAWSARKLR